VAYYIVTLDPNKFAEKKQRRLFLGDIQQFTPHVSLKDSRSPVITSPIHYDRGPINKTNAKLPYPTDTRAFLYYSLLPGRPRISGELRLRVTSSKDPASFESGSDLLRPDGQVWSRSLYTLSKYFPPLYEKLREDQFIPDDLDTAMAALPERRQLYRLSQVLYTLNDSFIVDFNSAKTIFFLITEQGLERLPLKGIFTDWRVIFLRNPYTGAYTSHHLSILLY
jgi:hypothetical protein